MKAKLALFGVALPLLSLFIFHLGAEQAPPSSPASVPLPAAIAPGAQELTKPETESIQVPPPPFSDGIFPCSDCHDGKDVNTNKRVLVDEHTNIQLKHGEGRWCLDCHNPTDRDKLRLANGTLVEFTESYKLCGQCHGTRYREWKAGVHGKRTGDWNGKKQYLLCAHCHNPHQPKFKPIKPLPPPIRPIDIH